MILRGDHPERVRPGCDRGAPGLLPWGLRVKAGCTCVECAHHVTHHASGIMEGNHLLSTPIEHLEGLSSGDQSGMSSHHAWGALAMGMGDYGMPEKHQKVGSGVMMAQEK